MKRRHTMPFGAEILPAGGVRFQLWAPGASNVDLRLVDEDQFIAMTPHQDGWYTVTTDRARDKSRYCFRINNERCVPDPVSRYNPQDVDEPSMVWDPARLDWRDTEWRGRPWDEAVIYELHVGTFSQSGNYQGVIDRLDYLKQLGITAIELMPLADFSGRRNWGYDGVLPFAPDAAYGTPDDLKALVQAAHARGLMIFLDVVYNHFGPRGNYLALYARQFFTERHQTLWGAGINFDGPDSRVVRDFYVHNAIYWLEEYHFDGLRFDAVHAIADDSQPDILEEIAERVRAYFGATRHIHLVLENDHNAAHYLTSAPRARYTAQWNDDIHHALHVLLTGERDSYYSDYADRPLHHLGRCLAEGFAYQGEHSGFRGAPRGEPSAELPATAFVNFLQNHDQIGNRAFGDRIHALASPAAVRAATTVLLLAPQPPLLFMGQEFGATTPFLFFCDFTEELAQAVRDGRRREFERFAQFSDPKVREQIPDPNDEPTFRRSQLNWNWHAQQAEWLDHTRTLLAIRRREIVPRLGKIRAGQFTILAGAALQVTWPLGNGEQLILLARLSNGDMRRITPPTGRVIAASDKAVPDALKHGMLLEWSAVWMVSASSGSPTP